jgi:hypothetical protein
MKHACESLIGMKENENGSGLNLMGPGATHGHQNTPVRIDNLKACCLSLYFPNTRRHWKPVNNNTQNIHLSVPLNKETNP